MRKKRKETTTEEDNGKKPQQMSQVTCQALSLGISLVPHDDGYVLSIEQGGLPAQWLVHTRHSYIMVVKHGDLPA
jgi:hypothetical protein